MLTFVVSVAFLFVSMVSGYSTGPPTTACQMMQPLHTDLDTTEQIEAQANEGLPYTMTLSNTCYKEGSILQVFVNSTHEDDSKRYFEGLFVQVQENNVPATSYGEFAVPETEMSLKTMDCFEGSKNAISHKEKKHYESRLFHWIAPAGVTDKTLHFRATIVKGYTTFWMNVMSEALTYDAACDDKTLDVTAKLQPGQSGSHEDKTDDGGKDKTGAASSTVSLSVLTAMLSALMLLTRE